MRRLGFFVLICSVWLVDSLVFHKKFGLHHQQKEAKNDVRRRKGLIEKSYKIPWLPRLPAVPTESSLRLIPQRANDKYDICKLQQPCVNDGQCIREGNSYFCDCRPQHYGKNCEFRADERGCTDNACKNNATCYTVETDLLHGANEPPGSPVVKRIEYKCWCKRGVYGQFCDFTESMRNCAEDVCNHHGLVEYSADTNQLNCSCRCELFYSGEHCEVVSPCRDHKCVNGGNCQLNSTGHPNCVCPKTVDLSPSIKVSGDQCEDVWLPDTMVDVGECRPCASNFTDFVICLESSEITQSQLSGWWATCDEEVPDCFSTNLTETNCLNNGTCVAVVETLPADLSGKLFALPRCECPPEYEGNFCERRVFDPCTNLTAEQECEHGNCSFSAADRSMQCICESGYYGPQCEFERPCTSYDCGDAMCIELRHEGTDDEYPICVCNSNQDVNSTTHRCSNPHYGACRSKSGFPNCKNGAYCYPCVFDKTESPPISTCDLNDTNRGFRCVCTPGFAPPLCDRLLGPCDGNRCQNGANCRPLSDGTFDYECECPKGYEGAFCEVVLSACDRLGHWCVHGGCVNDRHFRRGFSCQCDHSHMGINCNTTKPRSLTHYLKMHFVWSYPLILFIVLLITLIGTLVLREYCWKESSKSVNSTPDH